ncbi:MAG TPA: ABC transporter permease [Verrucomicrobiae bacterium]|nr:ABC transporter permease [Verrucomicrobiae bacterium]
MNDLKFALRQLLKNPGFTATAVITLALGIGANTAIFSIIYGVLLKPLPYPNPGQLVRVYESNADTPRFPMSAGDFQDYREQNKTLASLALYTRQDLELTMDDRPELLSALRITSGFFSTLGTQPMLGREFRREDETPGNHHVAILSHSLWQRRFNGDPSIVGKSIRLTGEAFTVVGVMPAGVQHVGGDYRSMPHGETVDFWWPISLRPQDDRGSHYMNSIARLKPGVSVAQASADLNVIAERLAKQFPDTSGYFRIAVHGLRDEIVGHSRTTLWILFGAVSLVLLIACVNVANLLLARSSARAREMAVRTAIGAGRWRVVRQLLTESLLLAAVGSAAGILLAQCGMAVLGKFGPDQLPRLQAVRLDGHVLLFTLGLTLLTGLLFGLVPALQSGNVDLNGLLKQGGRGGTSGGQRGLRDFLVVTEVALALVLLVGTGLLVRSFWKLQQTAAGFDSKRVLTAMVSLPFANYENRTNLARFQQQLLERVAALPGVESAGLTSDLPWTGYDENNSFHIEGKAGMPNSDAGGRYHFVSADYFRTVGVPLLAGRFFGAEDQFGKTPPSLLVNQALATKYWPGESAVGKRITFSDQPKEQDWRTIVGVVGDVKDRPESAAAVPAFYLSLAQVPQRQVTLAVRTTAEPSSMITAVRNEVLSLDRDDPLADIKTLERVSENAVAGRKFTFWLVGCFAATALVLATIGIYGVLSYLVTQRAREIGVRMALGAQAWDVIQLTLKQGMRPTLLGVALGLAGAFALTRLMTSLLFGISATDPGTFIASAVVLVLAALLPCWLPARRAARVDPIIALRQE